jgi:hypothetical protein
MPSAPRFNAQHDALLVVLARYFRVSLAQAARHSYSPNSLPYVRGLLNDMIDQGYIQSYKGFSQGGNPPLVYSPSIKGWQYVEKHHGMPIPRRWRPEELPRTEYGDYLHDLAITDTGIAIERFCRDADPYVTFVQFQHDRFLPQTKIPLPDGTTPSFRPDAFVELHIQRDDSGRTRQRCHLLEIDRGTHYEKAIRRKFLMQLRYVLDGHYKHDYGTESLSYLWVCPNGEKRVTFLRKVLESVLTEQQATDLSGLFLFTPENPATVDPADLFIEPVWHLPFSDEPVSLFIYPSTQDSVSLDRSQYLPQADYEQFLQANGDDVLQVAGERDLV